jgi:hypothetical protein
MAARGNAAPAACDLAALQHSLRAAGAHLP